MTKVRLGRAIVAVGAVSLATLAACSDFGVLAGPSAVATSEAGKVEGVSRSSISPGAAQALEACGIAKTSADDGSLFSLDVVTGMGLVTPGRDANRYAPIGNASEIKTDKPAWIITTEGWLTLGPFAAGPARNPTCFVVAGEWDDFAWFVTGDQQIGEAVVTPFPQPSPDLTLPALAP